MWDQPFRFFCRWMRSPNLSSEPNSNGRRSACGENNFAVLKIAHHVSSADDRSARIGAVHGQPSNGFGAQPNVRAVAAPHAFDSCHQIETVFSVVKDLKF